MADDGMAGLAIQIPKTLIEDTIRAEMVRQLGDKREFMEAVIRTAMNEKSRDERWRYSNDREKPTVFQEAVTNMIQEEAKRVFGEWLDKHRKEIAAALEKHLTESKAARVKQIAEQLASGINRYSAAVHLTFKEDDS